MGAPYPFEYRGKIEHLPDACGLAEVARAVGRSKAAITIRRGKDEEFREATDRFRALETLPFDWKAALPEIRKLPDEFGIGSLAEMFGISAATISLCRRRHPSFRRATNRLRLPPDHFKDMTADMELAKSLPEGFGFGKFSKMIGLSPSAFSHRRERRPDFREATRHLRRDGRGRRGA